MDWSLAMPTMRVFWPVKSNTWTKAPKILRNRRCRKPLKLSAMQQTQHDTSAKIVLIGSATQVCAMLQVTRLSSKTGNRKRKREGVSRHCKIWKTKGLTCCLSAAIRNAPGWINPPGVSAYLWCEAARWQFRCCMESFTMPEPCWRRCLPKNRPVWRGIVSAFPDGLRGMCPARRRAWRWAGSSRGFPPAASGRTGLRGPTEPALACSMSEGQPARPSFPWHQGRWALLSGLRPCRSARQGQSREQLPRDRTM